ncbi:peptidoglycan bridge formation glycyltransferase FemA/FemB family protein [Candidatus Peribacteria bacterium]|nr:peptidoglycan bridge formation glycyltransferase FemA/FemB family protein [Candidatus Peribacteria bacterium]
MHISHAIDQKAWNDFLESEPWNPFLQSWTMGDVYADIGQKPIRLVAELDGVLQGICFAHLVPARRGKHLSVPYGPVISETMNEHDASLATQGFINVLKKEAKKLDCSFIRMSPFWVHGRHHAAEEAVGSVESPLHLLAEHVWYLPLKNSDGKMRDEKEILMAMRSTTRNLIRRAERDGVTVRASKNPNEELKHFLGLHEETRKRHGFVAYSDAFFRSQVKRFAERKECTLYLAEYQGNVISSSIHIHAFGETSYHHGASDSAHSKIPASYLLQWTAIKDAMKRGDRIYNFWGIAPTSEEQKNNHTTQSSHPFAGVTLFKTGFGGKVLNLMHCKDTPVTKTYWFTYAFERFRKWRRGF